MTSLKKQILQKERIKKIYELLERLRINRRHIELIKKHQTYSIKILNEALTHTSARVQYNHERLEFLGDAVLRLAASEYIEENFSELKVGDRSALRAQLVSDQWLAAIGKEILIKETMIIGPKALKDDCATNTLRAEGTEAMIGALYECLQNLEAIKEWLTPYWNETSQHFLSDPYRFNSKSALQEWSQGQGLNKPNYQVEERSKEHGDQKRFFCKVSINQKVLGEGWGSSIKHSEKAAANMALKKIQNN